jgi:predicted enzyme related to lactoylglutathione lyase
MGLFLLSSGFTVTIADDCPTATIRYTSRAPTHRHLREATLRSSVVRERWISKPARIEPYVITNRVLPRPVVHLELHTGNEMQASTFYDELLGWRPQRVRAASNSYLAIDLGGAIGGGIVECSTRRPLWLPYVQVDRVEKATERARRLGATVILEPCEGPSGWRSVVSNPAAGEVALWELKR